VMNDTFHHAARSLFWKLHRDEHIDKPVHVSRLLIVCLCVIKNSLDAVYDRLSV
jgi:hypothetical protein